MATRELDLWVEDYDTSGSGDFVEVSIAGGDNSPFGQKVPTHLSVYFPSNVLYANHGTSYKDVCWQHYVYIGNNPYLLDPEGFGWYTGKRSMSRSDSDFSLTEIKIPSAMAAA